MPSLIIRIADPALSELHTILGAGVGIQTKSGIALLELLCDQLGFDFTYIDQRVQTIFHNGRAVDRIDQVHIQDGDVVALSAAMPGLAGATLRKGGMFAALRKEISHTDPTVQIDTPQGVWVTLKMFNLVARELCIHLLRGGVWVKPEQLQAGLRLRPEVFSIAHNGRPVTIEELPHLGGPGEFLFTVFEPPDA
jgi:hypothetical protein